MKRKLALLALFLLLGTSRAWAVFSLDVTSIRSGRDIRFETIREGQAIRNEEVTFTITTTEAKQYRVTQAMNSPLMNERGGALPADAVKMFSPSSVRGVLRPTLPTALGAGTDVIYTSDLAGTGDSFVLAFAIEPSRLEGASGTYQSQLVYTLEAVQGGASPVTVIRNIRIEIATDFKMRITSPHGGQDLNLGRITKQNPSGSGALEFEINSSIGVPYRINQQLSGPLSNGQGDFIDADRILFETEGLRGALSDSPALLFHSDDKGGSANFQVVYSAPDLSKVRAGFYRSSLSFTAESNSGLVSQHAVTVPVELEVTSIFNLDVQFEEGTTSLNFGSFSENKTQESRRVLLKTFTNLGTQYQVSQTVTRPMTNQEGQKIKNFSYVVKGPREAGFVSATLKSVEIGDSVLFISDNHGTPADLTVEYQLSVATDQRGGQYSSDIAYAMTAI